MILLLILSFLGIAAGWLLLFQLTPKTMLDAWSSHWQQRQMNKLPIAKQIRLIQHPKPLKGWRATISEATAILQQMGYGQRTGLLFVMALVLAICGAMLAFLFNNLWL